MAENNHIVKFWRGTRDSYNIIAGAGMLDYWTRYSVKEKSGIWTEYFGDNLLTPRPGQLLPVIDIVETVPDASSLHNGDRYLVKYNDAETSGEDYYIIEVRVSSENGQPTSHSVVLPFDDSYTVRVKSRGYKAYQLVDGKLVTYDEVDCGTY